MMIPVETERCIRKLLEVGLPDRDIAQRTNVCHETVGTVRKMCDLVDGLPKRQKKSIIDLLEMGLPVGSIEMKLRIPKGIILAVRRYYYLHMQCPTCGSSLNIQNIAPRAKTLLEKIRGKE